MESDAVQHRVGYSNRGAQTIPAGRCHTATWVYAAVGHPCDGTCTHGHPSDSLLSRSFLQRASTGLAILPYAGRGVNPSLGPGVHSGQRCGTMACGLLVAALFD